MDLKQYAGKDVVIQFKPGYAWCVHHADESGPPTVTMTQQGKESGPAAAVLIRGLMDADGALLIEKGKGGSVSVIFADDVIFSVVAVSRRPSALILPTTPHLGLS